ncbi:MAG: diacylglycerol kinase [Actinobacteria bacterium RBG_16_64_13]|nr:MAG: diacylglycerol kinase [Actinobacteria bacterium RBG_16_64_13]
MAAEGRKTTLLQSFNHAFQGLVHAVRRERNMRFHLAVAVVVLIVSIFLNLSKLELAAVLVAITFVLVAELVNSAIETVVDIVTDEFDPRAKIAKDVAAGAVLVAAINALAVAYLVLADRLTHFSLDLLTAIRRSPTHLTIVAFAVVMALVIAIKATRRRGTPLSGGLPSGHTALAFAGWTAVTFIVGATREGLLVSAIAFVMGVLVAQSRMESGIHSLLEVLLGALLGILATTLIFQVWF